MLPQMMPLPWMTSLVVIMFVVVSFYLTFSWRSPTHHTEKKTNMKSMFMLMPW